LSQNNIRLGSLCAKLKGFIATHAKLSRGDKRNSRRRKNQDEAESARIEVVRERHEQSINKSRAKNHRDINKLDGERCEGREEKKINISSEGGSIGKKSLGESEISF